MEEDGEGSFGQNYAIKKRRLTWMKYADDGDHFGENFDIWLIKIHVAPVKNGIESF